MPPECHVLHQWAFSHLNFLFDNICWRGVHFIYSSRLREKLCEQGDYTRAICDYVCVCVLCERTCRILHFASPERPAELVVVHVWFALPLPPQPGQPLGVPDDKLAPLPSPADGAALASTQQLQEEVPQLDLSGAGRPGRLVGPVGEQHCWRDMRKSCKCVRRHRCAAE